MENFIVTFNDTYKQEKEEWVTGFTGTDAGEVFLSTITLPLYLLLLTTVISFLIVSGMVKNIENWKLSKRVAIEFVFLIIPVLLSVTLAAGKSRSDSYLVQLLVAPVILSLCLHFISSWKYKSKLLSFDMNLPGHAVNGLLERGRMAFVTNFRSGMMICTIIAILAVDFPVYPRRYVKTETFGFGMMDVGVGAFVFSAAMISRQTRRLTSLLTSDEPKVAPIHPQYGHFVSSVANLFRLLRIVAATFRSTILSLSPLLLIGGIRLVVHAAINYQEHTSEYGVHWNFFFTLAAVALASTAFESLTLFASPFLRPLIPAFLVTPEALSIVHAVLAVVVALLHQSFLSLPLSSSFFPLSAHSERLEQIPPERHSGSGSDSVCASLPRMRTVQEFVLCAPRAAPGLPPSFFMQNREGLTSVAGFFAIHLLGVAGGLLLARPRVTGRQWARFAGFGLLLAAALLVPLSLLVVNPGGPSFDFIFRKGRLMSTNDSLYLLSPSRRLVNLAYILWISALLWTALMLFLAVELAGVKWARPGIPAQTFEAPTSRYSSGSRSNKVKELPGQDSKEDAPQSGASAVPSAEESIFGEGLRSRKKAVTIGDERANMDVSTKKSRSAELSERIEADSRKEKVLGKVFDTDQTNLSSIGKTTSPRDQTLEPYESPILTRIIQILPQYLHFLHKPLRIIFSKPIPFSSRTIFGGSVLLESFNTNYLAIFMFSNILVGIVNLTVRTLHASTLVSMIILCFYLGIVCTVAVTWRSHGIQLKFW